MAADFKPGLSVRLPFGSPEEFLRRYGANLSRGGVYLRAKTLRAPGTALTLEVKLQDGRRVLYASAVVAWVTGARGEGLPGMGFKFITLDAASRRFLESAAAAMPHARSNEPPLPPNVGLPDSSPDALEPPATPPSQAPVLLPSEASGRLAVGGAADVDDAPAFEPAPEPPREGPVIGIDLGTTNACAAAVIDGQPTLLTGADGQGLVPSVVALSPRGRLLVGGPARAQLATHPKWVAWGFKRLLGQPIDAPAVQAIIQRFPYEVWPTPTGGCAVRLGNRDYPIVELSALVLMEVRALAERRLGQPVHRAVITVPAWYDERQRQSVREAGRLAGLYVERIVNEPTAAALAWSHGRQRPERLLVYDLGGGTFDASVLEVREGVHEVVSTGGNTFLGGMDFDAAIVRHLTEAFRERTGAVFEDRVAVQRVYDAAERAKVALSELLETRIHVPFVGVAAGKPLDVDVTLTRQALELVTRPLVDETMAVCQEILRVRDLRADDIDAMVLVGGQSRAPLVKSRIALLFGKEPVSVGRPEEAVALGAALLADALDKKAGLLLIDVLARSIGVGLPGGRFHPIIHRNTALPVTRTWEVRTTRDGQRDLELSIFQGEDGRVAHDTWLGSVTLDGLPPAPRGAVAVELAFELDNECLLTVSAREPSTGRAVASTFATGDTPAAVRARVEALEAQATTERQGLRGWLKRVLG